MPAYLISLCRHVTDRKRLEDYWANVAPAFKGFDAKPLVAYKPFEVLEGDGGVRGVVLFEFSSMEEARHWYTSAAYQEVKKRREGAQPPMHLPTHALIPRSRLLASDQLVTASAFLRTDPFNYRGSSVAAGEKPSRRRPRETRTVDATTTVTANPTPNSVVMYFAQPTGAVSGSNMP